MAKIFNLVNMSELPALSDNVSELLSLLGDDNTTTKQLTKAILKDVSLTSKVLQVVNSAYYSRGTKIGSVCRAISMIGLSTINELATSIALFENFAKAGGDKEKVTKLLTQSYLGGNLAKCLCIRKNLQISQEEAFICGLFHNLGEIIVLIYLPDLYRRIETEIKAGHNKHCAARKVLNDLTFYQIGMQIADFWNLLDKIIYAMHPKPPKPRHAADELVMLMNVAAFSNQLTERVNNGGQVHQVFERYSPTLQVDKREAFRMFKDVLDASSHTSNIINNGIRGMKLHSKLIFIISKTNARYNQLH
ncbi:MAG: HDOD domain-containing protein [Desulfobulbaceae bacterium]|nr:HDOD domain-containing protein [Desulfobulbaceae bacterium]